ncbi:MAG: DNA/RNA non-specific endonuclease [Verrucomicrobiales bacterium]
MSPHFSDRDGYDADFLGEGFSVPLPALGAHEDDAVRPPDADPASSFAFRYRRFSVIMSTARRFCRVSAVNIDGAEPWFQIPRRSWRLDPRAPDVQHDDEVLYGGDTFSRGHMVRRKDPLWGSRELAKQANDDTFYYTNAVPQVQSFNDGLWGGLEDHLLDLGTAHRSRLSVFTGPIFSDDDLLYRDGAIAVPSEFFKLIVAVHEGENRLLAAAFVQSQLDVMPEEGAFPLPGFDPGRFVPDQVTVEELERRTGLTFGLKEVDVLRGTDEEAHFGIGEAPRVRLFHSGQIIFG